MSDVNSPVKVLLLGKEYPVVCGRDEEHELRVAARYLDDKMRKIRDGGRIIGTERIAVMAALNIAHELIQAQQQLKSGGAVGDRLSAMSHKIDNTLGTE
ncbi:MAG: cell division protein ZapA [Methylococcaceae bacterium]|nr:cell division protein ZapA [Methylococcaceae bacterium]